MLSKQANGSMACEPACNIDLVNFGSLLTIVINLSITFYHRELENPLVYETIERADRRGKLVEMRSGLDDEMIAEQGLEAVANLLGAISGRTCQTFLMQRGGYSYKEIASAFAIKPRTVEKHVRVATLELEERPDALSGLYYFGSPSLHLTRQQATPDRSRRRRQQGHGAESYRTRADAPARKCSLIDVANGSMSNTGLCAPSETVDHP